jgi:hypothetical protein
MALDARLASILDVPRMSRRLGSAALMDLPASDVSSKVATRWQSKVDGALLMVRRRSSAPLAVVLSKRFSVACARNTTINRMSRAVEAGFLVNLLDQNRMPSIVK